VLPGVVILGIIFQYAGSKAKFLGGISQPTDDHFSVVPATSTVTYNAAALFNSFYLI
jgi:hypothetical protein